tara:strand:- start:2 stop:190 length:189 start_codon:yes stop_codon:yes gene_type:complete
MDNDGKIVKVKVKAKGNGGGLASMIKTKMITDQKKELSGTIDRIKFEIIDQMNWAIKDMFTY